MATMITVLTLILLSTGIGSSLAISADDDDWSVHHAIDQTDNTTHKSSKKMKHSIINCQVEVFTSISDDNINTVFNDNADGKGLLLFSDLPDMCYVRDISQAELLQSARTCVPGLVSPTNDGEATHERRYIEGAEINAGQLPENLRGQCQDRRIISLIDVTTTNGGSRSEGRVKRACVHIFIVVPRTTCTNKEYGWWATKRYAYTCETITETQKHQVCGRK